jgi:hypothetical protein
MAQVRPVAESAKKFVTRATAAAGDYQSGVANAGPRWQAGAEASNDAFKQGIQEALNDDRFIKGVRKAGAQKYQANAVKLGPDRFRTGVSNAEQAYANGTAPFIAAMQGFDYGPGGARGSAQRRTRIDRHIDLMRKTKREQLGA